MQDRSEEVQDIIDRMPTGWCWWVFGIVTILIITMFTLSIVIHYPETVDGEVSITATTAPVRLVASATGRLHPLLQPGANVRQGEVLAYVEGGVNYQDYLMLKQYLQNEDSINAVPPSSLALGELSNAYNAYVVSLEHWLRLSHSQRYATVRKSLKAQIEADQRVARQLALSKRYREKVCENLSHEMSRDTMLSRDKLVSLSEMEVNANNYYAQVDAAINVQANQFTKQAEIRRTQTEIARSLQEEEEIIEESYSDMQAKRSVLMGELRLWEEKYLLIAPMPGKLDYLGFWHNNSMVAAGTEILSILPPQNQVVGEAHISSSGAGKVKIGQEVNVKLRDFPYDEYGLIKGRVISMSKLTNKIQAENHVVESYLVQIEFPGGLVTNFDKHLPLNFESKGTAEIITQPKRLIQRLFDNLKAKTEK